MLWSCYQCPIASKLRTLRDSVNRVKIFVHTPASVTAEQWIQQAQTRLERADLFYGHGTDNPGSEAQWLLVSVLTRSGVEEITENTPIPENLLVSLDSLLQRRIDERIPLAYLLHEAWFAGHCFYVDERVLVPRSPIAELVENHFQPLLEQAPSLILDLCCGGGCIGIASALAFPESQVLLVDISDEALAVARINIERFGLQDRVSTVCSDLLGAIDGRFDLIVSNPPYVPEAEYKELPVEYHREPVLGLVSEQEGLQIPLQILAQAADYLTPQGSLILETGYTWQALDQAVGNLPLLWLDFEYGGEGVCAVTAQQLRQPYQKSS